MTSPNTNGMNVPNCVYSIWLRWMPVERVRWHVVWSQDFSLLFCRCRRHRTVHEMYFSQLTVHMRVNLYAAENLDLVLLFTYTWIAYNVCPYLASHEKEKTKKEWAHLLPTRNANYIHKLWLVCLMQKIRLFIWWWHWRFDSRSSKQIYFRFAFCSLDPLFGLAGMNGATGID